MKNNNLYNDKELWDDADLNWYDYGFRNYDPQIGRFPQLDPLTDRYPELTPYQYASDEPIANIDMDGLEAIGSTVASSVGNAVVSSASFLPNIAVQGLSKAAVAEKTFNALNIGINAFKLAANVADNTRNLKTFRNPNIPLKTGKTTGGEIFISKWGQGTPDHATNPDGQPEKIDGVFDLFSWSLKARPHPIVPDLSTPDDALGQLNDVTKELGESDNKKNYKSEVFKKYQNQKFDPNSIVDPRGIPSGDYMRGSLYDTGYHPERTYNTPMWLIDSSGNPTRIVMQHGNTNKSDTINTN